jgi:hypothetical protein
MLFFLSLSLSLHFPLVFNGNHFRRQYVLSWYYSNCFESRCSSYTCRFFYFDFIFDFVCVFWGGFMCWGGIKKGRDWCMWGGGILYWILSRPHPTVSYFWRNKIKNQTKKENKSITIHSILVHLTLCLWFNLLLPPPLFEFQSVLSNCGSLRQSRGKTHVDRTPPSSPPILQSFDGWYQTRRRDGSQMEDV